MLDAAELGILAVHLQLPVLIGFTQIAALVFMKVAETSRGSIQFQCFGFQLNEEFIDVKLGGCQGLQITHFRHI